MTLHSKILMFTLSAFALFAAPLAQGGDSQRETLQDKILHAMLCRDLSRDAMAAVKRKSGLSDDEFSAALVDVARTLAVTNLLPDYHRGREVLRMFTISFLGEFGTTNALDFLEQEVLGGKEPDVAFDQYARITGYDERFIDLSSRVVEHYTGTNRIGRCNVYRAMHFCFGTPSAPWRQLDDEKLTRMRRFLCAQIQTESIYMPYLDSILCEVEPSYARSPQREEALRRALNDPANLPLPRSDLGTILAKIEAEKAAAKEREEAEALRKERVPRPRLRWVAIGAGAVALLVGGYALTRRGRKREK